MDFNQKRRAISSSKHELLECESYKPTLEMKKKGYTGNDERYAVQNLLDSIPIT
jgi:hypothetical protein